MSDALRLLDEAGFTMVTLTKSPPTHGPDALDRASVGPLIKRRLSVDAVGRYKPAAEACRMVERAMACTGQDLCMVAAHARNTLGAEAGGWRTALLIRGVNPPLPLAGVPRATPVGTDSAAIARTIVAEWG